MNIIKDDPKCVVFYFFFVFESFKVIVFFVFYLLYLPHTHTHTHTPHTYIYTLVSFPDSSSLFFLLLLYLQNTSDEKYLYGLKPILSTNACGDGRIHSFENSEKKLELLINKPKINNVLQSGVSYLDIKSPSSPKQKPSFHRNNVNGFDKGDNEGQIVTVVGIDPTGETTGGLKSPLIKQSQLRTNQNQNVYNTERKQYERYWRYVDEYVPNTDIAPMNMVPLLNVHRNHLDVHLTPPGARYQMGGIIQSVDENNTISGAKNEKNEKNETASSSSSSSLSTSMDGLVQGVQVSMISSLPDLMPGSGEHKLLKATCRSDGRFWSHFRKNLKEWEKDHSLTNNIDETDEFALLKAEEIKKERHERIEILTQSMGHLNLKDISRLCALGMNVSMLEMKDAKDMLGKNIKIMNGKKN